MITACLLERNQSAVTISSKLEQHLWHLFNLNSCVYVSALVRGSLSSINYFVIDISQVQGMYGYYCTEAQARAYIMLTPAAIAHTSVGWLLTVSLYSNPHTELRIIIREANRAAHQTS